jgi:hypothetical protein
MRTELLQGLERHLRTEVKGKGLREGRRGRELVSPGAGVGVRYGREELKEAGLEGEEEVTA